MPKLIWDIGTAYDLFVSLEVLHEPARYGLRGSWAAGVRSRLPADKREFLQEQLHGNKLWAIPWLTTFTGPKDGAAVLGILEGLPAEQRIVEIASGFQSDEVKGILYGVKDRGSWHDQDMERLRTFYQTAHRKAGKKKKISDSQLSSELDMWANASEFGDKLLDALKSYYEVFFAEEEERIRPALESTVERAKTLAGEMSSLPELLEELSQGLRFDYEGVEEISELRMIPSFWTTPLSLFTPYGGSGSHNWIFMFGGRPPDASLVPGEVVPELLYQTLKALADPTRLRIMRYLSEEPSTPAELARRLRLRSPTVLHHLDALRLARLVHVTLSYQGRRYEARREAVDLACQMLDDFLERK